jgi:hypothetical protein
MLYDFVSQIKDVDVSILRIAANSSKKGTYSGIA